MSVSGTRARNAPPVACSGTATAPTSSSGASPARRSAPVSSSASPSRRTPVSAAQRSRARIVTFPAALTIALMCTSPSTARSTAPASARSASAKRAQRRRTPPQRTYVNSSHVPAPRSRSASGSGGLEAGPVAVAAAGVRAQAHGARAHPQAAPAAGRQRAELDLLAVVGRRAEAGDARPAAQPQPVAVALDTLERRGHGQLRVAAAEPERRPRQAAVAAQRIVAVPAAADAHGARRRLVLRLEAQHREHVVEPALADELPLQPVDRERQPAQVGTGRLEEGGGALHEQRAVRVAGAVEDVEMELEVVGDDARLVPAQRLARPVLGDVRAHLVDRGEPVEQDLRLAPPLGDRERAALADAPQVDGGGDDVDPARLEVGGQRDRDVLVHDALREPQRVLVPERAPPELVPGGAVGQQRALAGDVRRLARLGERALQEERLLLHPGGQPVHVAAGEVRAAAVERAEQQLVGVRRQHVVAVEEREELAAGRAGAGVAGAPEAAVRLPDQPEAAVTRGERAGDPGAGVGRPVVDHDHLEIAHGLRGERLEARLEVGLDVEHRDDDADARHRPILGTAGGGGVASLLPFSGCSQRLHARAASCGSGTRAPGRRPQAIASSAHASGSSRNAA